MPPKETPIPALGGAQKSSQHRRLGPRAAEAGGDPEESTEGFLGEATPRPGHELGFTSRPPTPLTGPRLHRRSLSRMLPATTSAFPWANLVAPCLNTQGPPCGLWVRSRPLADPRSPSPCSTCLCTLDRDPGPTAPWPLNTRSPPLGPSARAVWQLSSGWETHVAPSRPLAPHPAVAARQHVTDTAPCRRPRGRPGSPAGPESSLLGSACYWGGHTTHRGP